MNAFDFQITYYFTEICSLASNWELASIGSDNGLAPDRRQAIIWTNGGLFHWHMPHSPSVSFNADNWYSNRYHDGISLWLHWIDIQFRKGVSSTEVNILNMFTDDFG